MMVSGYGIVVTSLNRHVTCLGSFQTQVVVIVDTIYMIRYIPWCPKHAGIERSGILYNLDLMIIELVKCCRCSCSIIIVIRTHSRIDASGCCGNDDMWSYGKDLSIRGITVDNPYLIPNTTLMYDITNGIGQIKIVVRTCRTFHTPTTFDIDFVLPEIMGFVV